jgi:hypothetical protein
MPTPVVHQPPAVVDVEQFTNTGQVHRSGTLSTWVGVLLPARLDDG